VAKRDWVEWHRDYDDPGSLLSRRLELVQGHLRAELQRAPAGDVRLISLCAGQGRDVTGALTGHPRRDDVRARLVELDERNAALARQAAQAARTLPAVSSAAIDELSARPRHAHWHSVRYALCWPNSGHTRI
jgi:hypothetical protein